MTLRWYEEGLEEPGVAVVFYDEEEGGSAYWGVDCGRIEPGGEGSIKAG